MSRGENETNKTASNTKDASAPVKSFGKFKFNSKPSRLQSKTDTNDNCTLDTFKSSTNSVNNISTASNASDCVVISDDEQGFTTAKGLLEKELDDDIFGDFGTDEMMFTKKTKTTKKEATCMEDLYAKYGTPVKEKSSVETFDIDKELNSNSTYVNAVKKLDENMQQLRATPKKTATVNKFKFNTRPKPATATAAAQNTTLDSTSNSSSFSTNYMSTHNSLQTGVESNVSTVKPSTIASGTSFMSTNKSSNSTSSFTTTNTTLSGNTSTIISVDTPVSNPYKPITVSPPVENSFNTNDNSL